MFPMTTNKKLLIITILVMAITFMGTKKFIYDFHTQQLKNTLKALDEEYEKNRIFFEIERIKDELSGYSKEMLKSEKDLAWLLGKLSEIFNLLQLEVTSMEPQPLEKTFFYTRVPVKVKLVASYHALGELVAKLENLDKFIEISFLELRSSIKSESAKEEGLVTTSSKRIGPSRLRLDRQGFVLTEATIKLSAIYRH